MRSEADESMPRGEANVAVASAAALYVVGAALIATSVLLPHLESPAGAAAVAVTALLTASGLIVAVMRDHGTLLLAWAAELWGVVVIGFLCASTGGPDSPFALLYFFAVGHAAAFQPRTRFLVVGAAGLLAFLAPLAYSHVSVQFGAFASVGAVLALLTTGAIHIALERMREQRRRLEFLIAATARLDTSLDPRQTLRRIAGMALPELAELCVVDLLDGGRAITGSVAAALDPALAASVESAHREHPPEHDPGSAITAAIASGHASVHFDDPSAGEAPPDAGVHDRAVRAAGLAAQATIPMIARGRMLGVITYARRRAFETGQVTLLEDLTGRAALAYDNACLYDERAHVARTLRRSLMPAALPEIPGVELRSYFRPTGAGSEVGGDFYDVFGDRSSFWLVVGDVCGKGAEAAVLTGFLRHTTVAYAREGAGPASVLARVNSAMLGHDFDGRFATVVLARLGFRESGLHVTLATAGHPPALVSRADGDTGELGECGTLLGVFPDPHLREVTTILEPGDSLALYTDGLTEAQAPARVLAAEQLVAGLRGAGAATAQQAIDALLGLVDLRNGVRDDIAILAARVLTRPRSPGATTAAGSQRGDAAV